MRDEARLIETALSRQARGDHAGAAAIYRDLLAANPDHPDALHYLGIAEAAGGRIDLARSLLDRALRANRGDLHVLENYAAVLHGAGEFDAAVRLCERGLRRAPTHPGLLHVAAAAERAQRRWSAALALLDRLVARHPEHTAGHFLRGSVLARMNKTAAALAAYERALALDPRLAEAHLDIGTLHAAEQRPEAALAAYDRALASRSDYVAAWLGRGGMALRLDRHDEALAAYDRALALQPDCAEAMAGRGNALVELGRHEEAAAVYDKATGLHPAFAGGWVGRGNLLVRRGRYADASMAFDHAITLDSSLAEAWLGRGLTSYLLSRHERAIAAYDRAIELAPAVARAALVGKGDVHYATRQYEDALATWGKARTIGPDTSTMDCACQLARMHLCDWTGFAAESARVRAAVVDGKRAAPLSFIALPSTAAEQLRCARVWMAHSFPRLAPAVQTGEPYAHERIRVAYMSSDFRRHAVAVLAAGLFEHHDRRHFEITGLSIGPDDGSEMRRRIAAGVDDFVDAAAHGDESIAALVRAREIDILVDLNGLTAHARTGALALRPAPIQVNWLGYPGTLGAEWYDYIVADPVVIPDLHRGCYAEKVVHLPDTYLVNDDRRAIAERMFTRAELGLPPTGVVFCCFNNAYKLTPDVFDVWMRILRRVDGSVLWLSRDNEKATAALRQEAARRGVRADRLIFAPRMPRGDEHLARQRTADLFLDTLPYNAHTTAADALWAGLPVLTRVGETFAGRVAASVLTALELTELITTSADDYESLAVALASDSARLGEIKAKLARNRTTSPLFDTGLFARNLETAYGMMMERLRAGLPPDHLVVPPWTAG